MGFRDDFIKRVKERAINDLSKHKIEQLHGDDDVCRLWRCARPNSSFFHFYILCSPGWLTIYGDMGECMWSRDHDMLDFARRSIDSLDYFSSKASNDCRIREYKPELVEEWIEEFPKEWEECSGETWGEEQEEALADLKYAWEIYETEDSFYAALSESCFDDDEPPSMRFYTFHYLWKIEAIKWFLANLGGENV